MSSAKYMPASTLESPKPVPIWKRSIDLTCCVAALPALVVGTVVMGAVIKLSSPGPIFFRQERVGYKGRKFYCYKFRTMVAGADISAHQAYLAQLMASSTPMAKMDTKNDKRLIAGGWMLRASGLDELPQIINILRGEMSVVGPRPCLGYEYEKYEDWQRERFTAVPGLTGLWQVSGKNRTTFEEMIKLDIRYAKTKSTLLDIIIIFKTIPALLLQIQDIGRSRKENEVPHGTGKKSSGPGSRTPFQRAAAGPGVGSN